MNSVELRFREGSFARISLDHDLTVLHTDQSGFAEPAALRAAIGDSVLVEGRSRLGSAELLNVNAFPLDPIPGVADLGPAAARLDEDATIHLAEGQGAACVWSSRLDALTVWWLGSDRAPTADSCTLAFHGTSVTVPTTVMRSFGSATSPEHADPVVYVAAIPHAELSGAAVGRGPLSVTITAASLEIDAVVELGDSPRVESARVTRFERRPEQQAAVRDLPWLTVSEVDPQAPKFCVNNHPQETPPDEDAQENPEEEEETPEEENFAPGAGKAWVDDFVAVQVPRSGQVATLLRPGAPACVAGTSPTINCLTFYWLSHTHEPASDEVEVELDGGRLPHRYQRQRLRRALDRSTYLDVQVNSIQVPLASLAVEAGRSDLVPGAAGFELAES